jgi:hypothetical protein
MLYAVPGERIDLPSTFLKALFYRPSVQPDVVFRA